MTGFDSKRDAAADKLQKPWNEDEWRRNNWRCGHGWLRGEQCEICNAAQEPINLLEIRKIAAEYETPDSQIDSGNLYFALSKCLEHIDAQPMQEPVGTLNISRYKSHLVNHDFDYFGELPDGTYSVYTTPPKREWIWLSDADIRETIDSICQYSGDYDEFLCKKIERKIKELNT
jgi:hypothetical protein